jgi:hypothetical protein
MRGVMLVVLSVAGCGSVASPTADANVVDSTGPVDAAIDAGCQPTVLLSGGSPIGPQGWAVVMQQPADLSNGPDYVGLKTSTTTGATSGGQLLINYPGALETGKPFKIQVVMLVESVNLHNQFDSAAAIMGSFTPPFGAGADRGQMIYLDANEVGWADDTQSFDVAVASNSYHTYELSVDAGGVARVTVDGVQALVRTGFAFNGAIAIGDQTNDANVDSALRIRSVTRLCMQ